MKSKAKIAVIGLKGLPAFGGAAAVGENIIEQLKFKYDFTVYSISSHTDLHTGHYSGIKQIVLKRWPQGKLNIFFYYIRTALMVIFSKYDLVHLHHRDAAFIIPFLRLRYKVLVTTHGIGSEELSDKWNKFQWFFWLQENVFLRMSNYIISVSKRDHTSLLSKGYKSCKHIPNGVSIPENFCHNKPSIDIIFAAGRIVSFKGCHLLLESLQKMSFAGSVVIIGDLDNSSKYATQLKELSKNLNVSFCGIIKQKDLLLAEIIKGKLFIFPSLIEAMSMMLLEVVSCKTPVIASNIEANTDIFNSDELLFFESNNADDLAEKINYALYDYSSMTERAENAFIKVNTAYNWKIIGEEYNCAFEKLLSS